MYISRHVFLKLETKIGVLEVPVYTGDLGIYPFHSGSPCSLQLTKFVGEFSKWLCILLVTMTGSCEKHTPLYQPQGA